MVSTVSEQAAVLRWSVVHGREQAAWREGGPCQRDDQMSNQRLIRDTGVQRVVTGLTEYSKISEPCARQTPRPVQTIRNSRNVTVYNLAQY